MEINTSEFEPLDEDKLVAHIKNLRKERGILFPEHLRAHRASYPHECTEEAIEDARQYYP